MLYMYFSCSYCLIFILYDRHIILFIKRTQKSQPLALKRWIEAINFRMQGQFLKKFNDIVIPYILVMGSDQEICTILFLHGFYRVIDGLMVPIWASIGFNCHK